ncbi:tetratricopeptide repeat protein [Natronoflexus pectinivorans]|uniref:Tetratricopeptide repeat protein n=1 Tax=Natronoflexus pectinivorans TaxID=682526 RepID=A0A4V2RWP2_9BACT|nr:SH3 domain-containing protein [Natronoflexus pectinivorans]TCO09370.1 tetratricopeptide repeat protein [Natronoflexus pectinivorans]
MKLSHIYIVTILFIFTSFSVKADFNLIIEQANQHYMESEYGEAIELYEEVLKSGMVSADLYYNLGNAYYRHGYLPSAILNYERALLLAPQDRDIRHNLNLAYSQITDNIEPVGEFFLVRWFASFRNSANPDTWAWISIITFILFLAGLLFYFFSRSILFRKISFFFALLAVLVSGISFAFANNQKQRLENRNRAIVFSPSVTVRSAPEARGTELFVLHSGTRVRILQVMGNWYEIEIEDGNVGWVHAEHLEVI